jgi:hypothetical protein
MVKVYQCWRDKVVGDMRSDNHWKEKGEEFEDFNPTRRTPSKWWLLGFQVYRLIGAFTRKKQENKKKELEVDGESAC